VEPDTKIVKISGNTRAILTGERTALNFLQTLSSTATQTRQFADLIKGTKTALLDTRKTLPGLRTAQKYAVKVGGGSNHRKGLFDAYLIKENHIQSCGGIAVAIKTARKLNPYTTLEIEVKNMDEFNEALAAKPDIIMLDNFELPELRLAVGINKGRIKLEASGGIQQNSLVTIAETGIDYVSIGGITKNCQAIDLSLLITDKDSQ
jgi:nicotinate-nucleotide pyrophosphorylase (carboxylating)